MVSMLTYVEEFCQQIYSTYQLQMIWLKIKSIGCPGQLLDYIITAILTLPFVMMLYMF